MLEETASLTRSKLLRELLVIEPGFDFHCMKAPMKNAHMRGHLSLVSSTPPMTNTMFACLERMDKRLEELGIIEINGEMTFISDEELKDA